MQTSDLGLALKVNRIMKRRLARHIAASADLSASRLSDIENGYIQPTPEQVSRICAALGITPADLEHAV